MTTYLLVISFLLHGILLVAIVLLSLRVSKAKEIEKRQAQVAKEIEDTFTAYLLEIKEENERLLNKLEENGENGERVRVQEERYNAPQETKKQQDHPTSEPVTFKEAEEDSLPAEMPVEYKPPLPEEQVDYQPSIESRILQMYKQGATVEQIAKRLDRGTTEIELTLKFQLRMS
ncbi:MULTISPECIES: DUF6115 domain-containing protein [Pontibacillus]|uniref:Coupling factor for flagellin transcription and translation n=1 Tax=Pontibacillus chungwhensis TaxID=265426 RepID=A0ABY8V427_9BACI|nr:MULTISPECIES: hypothetical protein [Pontibacillus]MCD5322711.1 hypothetical protein [Pontibacillus sp. HN14]WIF99987.1 hypothetical protein QNI29_10105 [Pontibacillus chungwhensis]